jgi:hypothetical protein
MPAAQEFRSTLESTEIKLLSNSTSSRTALVTPENYSFSQNPPGLIHSLGAPKGKVQFHLGGVILKIPQLLPGFRTAEGGRA